MEPRERVQIFRERHGRWNQSKLLEGELMPSLCFSCIVGFRNRWLCLRRSGRPRRRNIGWNAEHRKHLERAVAHLAPRLTKVHSYIANHNRSSGGLEESCQKIVQMPGFTNLVAKTVGFHVLIGGQPGSGSDVHSVAECECH